MEAIDARQSKQIEKQRNPSSKDKSYLCVENFNTKKYPMTCLLWIALKNWISRVYSGLDTHFPQRSANNEWKAWCTQANEVKSRHNN